MRRSTFTLYQRLMYVEFVWSLTIFLPCSLGDIHITLEFRLTLSSMPFQEGPRSHSQPDADSAPSLPVYPVSKAKNEDKIVDVAQLEHVLSWDTKEDHVNYDRVDAEVAKYTSDVALIVSEEDNKRLKRLIDMRVLSIMIFTYFLQALGRLINVLIARHWLILLLI